MASSDPFVVYISSSHDLKFTVVASYEDTISSLKKKAEAGHLALFPDNGRIVSKAMKIWHEGIVYDLLDEIPVRSLLDVDKGKLSLYMDAVPVTEVVSDAVPVTEVVQDAVPVTEVVPDAVPVTEVVPDAVSVTDKKKRPGRPKKNVVMVPDELRCIRKGGSGWRCPNEAMPNSKYCTSCKSKSSKRIRRKKV